MSRPETGVATLANDEEARAYVLYSMYSVRSTLQVAERGVSNAACEEKIPCMINVNMDQNLNHGD